MSGVEFLADSMLGRLAKWLRLMGFYVEYANSDSRDLEIIEQCQKRNLFLLSRDKELCSRFSNSMYMESDNHHEQLKQVLSRFHPDPSLYFSRCPVCNGELEKLETTDYKLALPESVKQRFSYIYSCKSCGKVYWEGSHFEAILSAISELESDL